MFTSSSSHFSSCYPHYTMFSLLLHPRILTRSYSLPTIVVTIICFAAHASMLCICILHHIGYYRSNTNNGDFWYHIVLSSVGRSTTGKIQLSSCAVLAQCLPGNDTSSSILHLPTSRIASASPVSSSGASSKELTIAHGSFPPPNLRISRLYFSPVSRLSGS